MANSIGAVTKFLVDIADQIYGHESLTSILDTPQDLSGEFSSARIIKVPKMAVSGLADYSKSTGYAQGDVNLEWVPYELRKDRGRKFTLDAVDNIDSAGKSLAMLEGTFIRENVVPEIDAYRFAQYATGAGTSVAAALDEDTIVGAIDAAIEALFEAGAPEAGRILYISSSAYTALKNSTKLNRWSQGTVLNRNVTMFDEIPIIKVPSARFYSSITLKSDGYEKNADGGVGLNFILMDRNAPLQAVKHNPSNLISPAENQSADGWIYKYRIFHDALVKDGKAKGIYVHKKTA